MTQRLCLAGLLLLALARAETDPAGLARAIFQELIEIDTTASSGDTT